MVQAEKTDKEFKYLIPNRFMTNKKINLSSFVFEITSKCNHDCMYCYNVWKHPSLKYPAREELSTEQIKKIISKLKKQTKIKYLAISGGEPLLRKDTPEIIEFCSENNIEANLLTNGSLLNEENCRKCVQAKTSIFEIPLLAVDEKIHYRLTGRGNLKDVIVGIKNLKKFRTKLVVVFVATKLNISQFKGTAEMAIALGADGLMFNRFNAGGTGIKNIEALTPELKDIKTSLVTLDYLSGYYGVSASVSIPIPKCLVNPADFRHLNFGYCPSGNEKSYFTIDPYGNVRICNHSPTILGNLLKENFDTILTNSFIPDFQKSVSDYCTKCKEVQNCWGGCKASAQVCGNGLQGYDPFLQRNIACI